MANSIVHEQHTPLSSIEEVIKNGLAKEIEAKRTGRRFKVEAGYIVQALNQACSEGEVVEPTKLPKQLIAELVASKVPNTQLEPKEFDKRRKRQLSALSTN